MKSSTKYSLNKEDIFDKLRYITFELYEFITKCSDKNIIVKKVTELHNMIDYADSITNFTDYENNWQIIFGTNLDLYKSKLENITKLLAYHQNELKVNI